MKTMARSRIGRLSKDNLFQRVGDICSDVNSALTKQELFELSMRKIMDLFEANRGSIFILEENNKDLILKIAFGMHSLEKKNLVKRLGEGIVGKVALLKKPIFVHDISTDKRFSRHETPGEYQTPSFICAPLLIKDTLIGVINISDKESGRYFTEDDMLLLDFLSSQMALNYRRIELYEKLKSAVKEKKSLKTQLGKTNEERQHLQKQIAVQERLATIGKLAGGIAHEFNNPLDGVIRYTNLCLEQSSDDSVVHSYLMEIKLGLQRMANIVKNLLACSRNNLLNKTKVNLNDVADYVVKLKQPDLDYRGITVRKKADKNMPLIVDLGIERVMMNLLHNAIDAVEKNGTIGINIFVDDTDVVIEFKDSGTGISRENIKKIFEPFFTTKDINKGCGLGLTIVSEIIKSYNGKIDVTSKTGKGTKFTITIPMENNV